MPDKFNLPPDRKLAEKIIDNDIEKEKKRLDIGLIGKFWGSAQSVPANIAALLVLLLLLFGIFYTSFVRDSPTEKAALSSKELWTIISPLITLAIGYLFGDKSSKTDKFKN